MTGTDRVLVDRGAQGWARAIKVIELELNLIRKMVGPVG